MFASRLAVVVCKPGIASKLSQRVVCRSKSFATEGKTSLRRARESIKATAGTASAEETAFTMGRGFVAGAAALGLGGLCFYGLGLSGEAGAIDRSAMWPEVVRQRIRSTYTYFGASLAFTAGTAMAVARNPTAMRVVSRGGWMTMIGGLVAIMGTGAICRSIPYTPGFGKKQLAWMAHSAAVGAFVAPLAVLGGPLLIRAACYTASMVGGLSLLAISAPSEKFLNMGGPLAMGLGVVFLSSIGTWFLPPTGALGAGMYSIAIYGGLVLFGMFLLYDTQKIIKRAETTPVYGGQEYGFDPINNSVGIYLDTVNIFIRIAMILTGNRRK